MIQEDIGRHIERAKNKNKISLTLECPFHLELQRILYNDSNIRIKTVKTETLVPIRVICIANEQSWLQFAGNHATILDRIGVAAYPTEKH